MDILSMVRDGGFVMYPLLLCSILVWGVAFEKMWYLFQFSKQFQQFHNNAKRMVEEKKFIEVKGLCRGVHPLIATPYMALFDGMKNTHEAWEQKIYRRLQETQMGLKRFLWILGTIGNSAPFIGLFGTVVGIIRSFDSMAKAGKGGFSVVAAGLSEALIATAAGIIVAIIAVVLFNYFKTRLATINLEFKNKLEDLMDMME